MDNPIKKYEHLKMDFELYKKEMEKKLRILESIINLGEYINSIVSKPNFLEEINNLIISKVNVDYSTIYLIEDNKYKVKASNASLGRLKLNNTDVTLYNSNNVTIINMDEFTEKEKAFYSKSIMSVPLIVGERVNGYIFLEHLKKDYFNDNHKIYMEIVARHIAVAIENAELYRNLEIAAETDSLTGIYNREAFYNRVEKKIRKKSKYAIVMIDIDNFKNINDEYGHHAGDLVLKETVKIISESIGKDDIAARYGGEEIILYIDKIDNEDEIYYKVDKIRKRIANNIVLIEGNIIDITASFGLSFKKNEERLVDVIKEADKLLYRAKRLGKNRVNTY